jgi:hypothetical protein
MQFSDELVSEIKKDYRQDYGIELSDKEANRYLSAYASLGSIVFDLLRECPARLAQAAANAIKTTPPCEAPHVPYSKTTATRYAEESVVESGRVGRSRAKSLARPPEFSNDKERAR